MKGDDTVSRVYAHALLELAFGKGVHQEVLRDLKEVAQLLSDQPKALHFLVTPNIRKESKRQVIDRAFGGRVSEIVQNFLKILVDKGRAQELLQIVHDYERGYHERQGELVVRLASAQPLDEEERDQLRSALRKKYGTAYNDFILQEHVEPALLGGLVLRTGDNVYDASLRSRLEALGDRLKTGRLKNEEVYED